MTPIFKHDVPSDIRYQVERLSHKITDVKFVVGGDGTLISAFHEFDEYSSIFMDRIYFPLNYGNLGFLTNELTEETIHQISERQYTVYEFDVLEITAITGGDYNGIYYAINDVCIERNSGQTVRLEIEVNGHNLLGNTFLSADGIIISTPLGSSAYNFSAGGQICHPLLSQLAITPICPHLPKFPPISFPGDTNISIYPIDLEHRPARIVIDGIIKDSHFKKVIIKKAKNKIKIAYLNNVDFTERLINKIVKKI